MLYTITLNPSLDYNVDVESLNVGELNRAKLSYCLPGGKGINVAIVLHHLEYPVKTLGFLGGHVGKMIDSLIQQQGLDTDFVWINQETRINVKVHAKDRETEINGEGPLIEEDYQHALLNQLSHIGEQDLAVLSGNVQKTLTIDYFNRLCETIVSKGGKLVVDTTGDYLTESLKYHPLFIKPNIKELEQLFRCTIDNNQQLEYYAGLLIDQGATNVCVSMGGDGAMLINKDKHCVYQKTVKGKVINTIGSGDSMVAGLVAGYLQNLNQQETLKLAVACGSASAFRQDLCTKQDVIELLKQF